jgi:hypothetical protein
MDEDENNIPDACIPCPKGYIMNIFRKCETCGEGTYSDEAGQTACKSCATEINAAFTSDKPDEATKKINDSKNKCFIKRDIRLSDSLGTILLNEEIGSVTLYYQGK